VVGRLAAGPEPCHTSAVRLSRPRVWIRAALLSVGGGFMLWRAFEAHAAAGGAEGPEAVLLARVALVEALMGALGLLAAAMAVRALRRRPRTHSLHLGDLPGRGPGAPQ
jgi:hypothetical protein